MSDKQAFQETARESLGKMFKAASLEVAGPAMRACMQSKGEKAIQLMARASIDDGFGEALLSPIGYSDGDTVVFELQLKSWRLDMAVFHMDGSTTVIEIKDGSRGIQSVLAGIGQVGLYAAVLGMSAGVRRVNRALLWTDVMGTHEGDQLVAESCRQAGVTPIYMPSVDKMLEQRMLRLVTGINEQLAQALGELT